MVNYAEEARRLAEESQRRMTILLDELQEINERSTASGREFADNLAADMDRFRQEHAGDSADSRAEDEATERLAAEAREHREAIARSMTARKANQSVAPVDDEDEEAKFYQRESWLI
ncbi:hypothetical protein AB0C34_18335 [Nocardia sp. NPDC049220]|uniref:hypothetical protein n=1 Tax=Nocardia sp. NPDC049220 TaxID=3155273 RepID=UPI0033F1AD13